MRLVQVFLLPSPQRSPFDAFPPGQDSRLPAENRRQVFRRIS